MKRALAFATVALVAAPVAGTWLAPADVPVDRLLANLRTRLAEAPGDAHRHYQLGRASGLAFALHAQVLRVDSKVRLEEAEGARIEPLAMQTEVGRRRQAGDRDAAATLELLATAVREQRIAVDTEPTNAAYRLGLAYTLASGAHVAALVDLAPLLGRGMYADLDAEARARCDRLVDALIAGEDEAERLAQAAGQLADERNLGWLDANRADPDPARQAVVVRALERAWRTRALIEYAAAFDLAWPEDSTHEWVSGRGDRELGVQSLVAHEAGLAVLELAERPELAGVIDASRIEAIRSGIPVLESLPAPPFITPIVLRLDGATTLAEHLDARHVVRFDLDGDGLVERRTWVRPETGLLAWDPDGRGEITSGRQLFGEATWWMFFRDGYDALDALDDDRDGWLFGAELAGLALWRDADGDALADPGEVEDLACLGVAAVATRPDTLDGLSPGATHGAWLADGRCVATWDWVAEPIAGP